MERTSARFTVPVMEADITIDTERGSCAAHFALPEGEGRYPGLVLIEEIWGVDAHMKSMAHRFAQEGFIVIAPELLPEDTLQKLAPEHIKFDLFTPEKRVAVQPLVRDATTPLYQEEFAHEALGKLRACIDYLVAHAQSNGKVGSIGFCFGGTYSFHLATNDPRLDACVVFYGRSPEPVDQVAAIACPVLEIAGEKDTALIEKLPELEAAMKEHDQDFQLIVYPGVGHAFMNDTNPHTYNATAASEAWAHTLAFLHKHLEE